MVKAVKQSVDTEQLGFQGCVIKDMTYRINSYLREDSGF